MKSTETKGTFGRALELTPPHLLALTVAAFMFKHWAVDPLTKKLATSRLGQHHRQKEGDRLMAGLYDFRFDMWRLDLEQTEGEED